MITIHKFAVAASGVTELKVHNYYTILCIQTQGNAAFIWIEVDTTRPKVDLSLWTYMTGEKQTVCGEYLGTFQLDNGSYVGHVYKV